jgi:hypothetical protein
MSRTKVLIAENDGHRTSETVKRLFDLAAKSAGLVFN